MFAKAEQGGGFSLHGTNGTPVSSATVKSGEPCASSAKPAAACCWGLEIRGWSSTARSSCSAAVVPAAAKCCSISSTSARSSYGTAPAP